MRIIQRKRTESDLAVVAGRAYDLPADPSTVTAAADALALANPLPAQDLAAVAVGTPLLVPPVAGAVSRPPARPPTELAIDSKDAVRRALRAAASERTRDLADQADVGAAKVAQIDLGAFEPRPAGSNNPNYLLRLRDRYNKLTELPGLAAADLAARVAGLDAELDALVRVIDGVEVAPVTGPPLPIRRFSQTTADASNAPELRLTVPKGFKILGGGAVVKFQGPGNMLTASRPESTTVWFARSKAHTLTSPATLTVHVVALFDPDDEFEVTITEGVSAPGNFSVASASVAPGFVLTGGGAQADVVDPGHLLTTSFPQGPTTWVASSQNHIVNSVSVVRAYAIGLRERKGRVLTTRHTDVSGGFAAHPTLLALVDPPFAVVGGGARSNSGPPGSFLTASFPDGPGWRAASKDHVQASPSTITAFAIGLAETITLVDDPPVDPTEPGPAPVLRVKRFTVTGPPDRFPSADITVPEGFKILSAGVTVNILQANSTVLLTSSFPTGPRSWRAQAIRLQSPGGATLTLTVTALEDPRDEFEVQQFNEVVPPKEPLTGQARVASGFTLTGGGARVEFQAERSSLLISSFPEGDAAWTVASGHPENPPESELTIFAIGLRARNGAPLASAISPGFVSDPNRKPTSEAAVKDGLVLVGGGAALGQEDPNRPFNFLTSSSPSDGSWRATGSDTAINQSPATITAFAIGLANVEVIP